MYVGWYVGRLPWYVNSACWLVEFRFNIYIKWTGMSVGKVNLGLWAVMLVD